MTEQKFNHNRQIGNKNKKELLYMEFNIFSVIGTG